MHPPFQNGELFFNEIVLVTCDNSAFFLLDLLGDLSAGKHFSLQYLRDKAGLIPFLPAVIAGLVLFSPC